MNAPLTHLGRACPRFRVLIQRTEPCLLEAERGRQPYEALVRAIAHQQLHGRAAETILARFIALSPQPFPPPVQVLAMPDAMLRACGFSTSKVASIRDVAAKTEAGLVPTRRAAARLSDAALIERLTAIRGVGRWTVEMLLIFTLGRPDILPVDDFGVREGYRVLHGLEAQPKAKVLAEIGAAWAPYRSTAALYLWRVANDAKRIAAVADQK